jgi:hypothetical protein
VTWKSAFPYFESNLGWKVAKYSERGSYGVGFKLCALIRGSGEIPSIKDFSSISLDNCRPPLANLN